MLFDRVSVLPACTMLLPRLRWCMLSSVSVRLLVGVLVSVLVLQPWAKAQQQQKQRFLRAAVAANGPECASVGRAILEKNGSAVDAAIATLFCQGIGCAQCMGLGGGFLATVYDATTGQVLVFNARERAPAATTLHMFANASSSVGGLSIAVPGELRGYGELYRRYGRLPWRDLVQPTADLCRRGHRVNAYMARALRIYSDIIKDEPSMRELYVNAETGEVWNEGDTFYEPTLAQTLDIIAEEGPEAMHNGSLTAALVRDITHHGGIVTEDDLRNFKAEWQKPITIPITDEQTLYTVPLPGTGSVLAFMLNLLRGWVGTEAAPTDSPLYWHRIVETFKYAYAKRTGLGDPSRTNTDFNIRELERNLSSVEWAQSFRSLIDDEKTFSDWHHYGPFFDSADDHGTAHVAIVAPDGSAVSATSTINYIWGSQRRSQSLGIMLNNEMDDFAIPDRQSAYGLPPSPANMLQPGLQPLSSMVPSIVLSKDGVAKLVVGAAGGSKITTQVALITMNTILEGRDLATAMNRPRLHHRLVPMELLHEEDFDSSLVESLKAKGHATTEQEATAGFAAIVAVAIDSEGYLVPKTDHRRLGSTDGF